MFIDTHARELNQGTDFTNRMKKYFVESIPFVFYK